MSAIYFYTKPSDLFEKLLREGRRAFWGGNPQEICDHFFNYCVTSHALRDWCIKHLKLHGDEIKNFHDEMNTYKYFPECRDIANSSKHFGLDNAKPSSPKVSSDTQEMFGVMTGENGEVYQCRRMQSLSIRVSNGPAVDLWSFLHFTSSNWINIFKEKHIDLPDLSPGNGPEYMFMELI